jgi:PIN domain nuclease of toxin-antitoxin system
MPLRVRRILANADVQRVVSVASELEIAIKNRLGKLQLTKQELAVIFERGLITTLPVRSAHADRLFDLPTHHNDPFDRIIISTALVENIPVITRDPQFRLYEGLRVIW